MSKRKAGCSSVVLGAAALGLLISLIDRAIDWWIGYPNNSRR